MLDHFDHLFVGRFHFRFKSRDNLAVFADEEFGEVPFDRAGKSSAGFFVG